MAKYIEIKADSSSSWAKLHETLNNIPNKNFIIRDSIYSRVTYRDYIFLHDDESQPAICLKIPNTANNNTNFDLILERQQPLGTSREQITSGYNIRNTGVGGFRICYSRNLLAVSGIISPIGIVIGKFRDEPYGILLRNRDTTVPGWEEDFYTYFMTSSIIQYLGCQSLMCSKETTLTPFYNYMRDDFDVPYEDLYLASTLSADAPLFVYDEDGTKYVRASFPYGYLGNQWTTQATPYIKIDND